MSVRVHAVVGRWLMATALLVSLSVTAGPATAAGPVKATRLVLHVAPATVHVGSPLVLTGSASPKVAGVPIVLQRLVGKSWHTVAHGKASAKGTFSLSLKAPAAAAQWSLRVVRVAKAGATAGVSATVRVRVVKALFAVKALPASRSVTSAQPIVVTGSVRPKAAGSVVLQRLVGRTWLNLVTTKLTHTSTFRFSTVRPAGSYRLRVSKAFTTTVAGGVSPALSVVVAAPVPVVAPPSVTTTALPTATGGVPYSATLTATGGTAPYLWAATGLPAGMTLSSAGVLSGTPTALGVTTVTVAVIDSAHRAGSAALAFTVVAAASGHLVAWGAGAQGQLGNNALTDSATPVAVAGMTSVKQVASGQMTGYALKPDGTVWAWGFNGNGQLGNNSIIDSSVPVQVMGLTGVTAIAGGANSGYALKADGTVWSWGYNGNGQLGDNSIVDSSVPVQVMGLNGVTAIIGGEASAYALTSDRTVWAWGVNTDGELGNSSVPDSHVPVQVSGLTGVTAIAAGDKFADALKSDGTVWSWGFNADGELGIGTMGAGSRTPVQVSGLSGVTAIVDGSFSGYALGSDSYVRAWGLNTYGQLGDGTKLPKDTPVELSGLAGVKALGSGYNDGYALLSGGTVWAWGRGGSGELGNGIKSDSSVPLQVSGLAAVISISTGQTSASGYAIVAG